MKKRIISLGTFLLLAGSLLAQIPFAYTVKGELSDSAFHGKEIAIICGDDRREMAKTVVNGCNFEFSGAEDSVRYCYVWAGREYGEFILEPGTIWLDMKTHRFPTGTSLNEALGEYNRLQDRAYAITDSIYRSVIHEGMSREERIEALSTHTFEGERIHYRMYKPFILKHTNDEVGAVAVENLLMLGATPEMLDDLYPHLGEWILSRPYIQTTIAFVEASRNMAPGKPFIDFEAEDLQGKKIHFSDFVGKGKYVLVDFAASWCGPCREEMANLKEVYEAYEGEKFDILTVAVENDSEASRKMFHDCGVNWNTMLNAGEVPAKLYGFRGIPRIMLFAPDGTIVANKLRGDDVWVELRKLNLKENNRTYMH